VPVLTQSEVLDFLAGLNDSMFTEAITQSGVDRQHLALTDASPYQRAERLLRQAEVVPVTQNRLFGWIEQKLGSKSKPVHEEAPGPSRSPIVIALEERGDELGERHLLHVERHLTVTLEPAHVEKLEALGRKLADADSIAAVLSCGVEAWRVLNDARNQLDGLFKAVVRSKSALRQPIAWTGKVQLLVRIQRAIAAACTEPQAGVNGLSSLLAGDHYFHPLQSSAARSMAARRRSDASTVEIKRIDVGSDADDAALLPRIAEALPAEVVVVTGSGLSRPLSRLAEMVGRHSSATRLAIAVGGVELEPSFVLGILETLVCVSFAGPSLLKTTAIEAVVKLAPARLSQQAAPSLLASVRNEVLRHAAAADDVALFRDALNWTTWSWVGRPLFAAEFAEVVAASYPHLMDLRSVATREWYCERREDIPGDYWVENLVEASDSVERGFHLYLTGGGGTGKSCFLRNVFETIRDNQSSVLPVWYKVDAPSAEWKYYEDRIKEQVRLAVERRLGKEAATTLVDMRKDLRFLLTNLVANLRREQAKVSDVVLFIDQLERSFESGDNPNQRRLSTISNHFMNLLEKVEAGKGVRVFIASRKQYLPDFLDSFEKARKSGLHFCVLKEIKHQDEKVKFVQTILEWCKTNELVANTLSLDDGACNELATKVNGHPLNLMLALIRMFSQGLEGPIGEREIDNLKPKPWEDLFYVDELLAAKDDLDWYFFLAMAHARTEIVRFTEVWWRLRLVSPQLTKRVNTLGRPAVLERLWLLEHLGRSIHARPLDNDKAGFVEFFHANLRDHLVSNVMNYGGKERLLGRKAGMPPVWRALDRLTAAAQDWKQSQQLLLRSDVSVLMEQKDVLVEPINVDKNQVEALYLLFMRDAEENRRELFENAKECFVYSAVVHDILGRWAFRQLFPNVSRQVALSEEWLIRSDPESRVKILQYLVELRNGEANALLCKLMLHDGTNNLGDVWQQLADILSEALFASRYRSGFLVAVLQFLLRQRIAFPGANDETARFGEFFAAACNGQRDELFALLKQVAEVVASLQDAELHGAASRLLEDHARIEDWLKNSETVGIDLAVRSREIHGYAPERIELRISADLAEVVTPALVEDWHRQVTRELGLPIPTFTRAVGELTARDPTPDGKENDARYGLSLLVDGRITGVGSFRPGLVRTLFRHWQLDELAPPKEGWRSHDEACDECVVWLSKTELDEHGWKRQTMGFDDAVTHWLAVLLRRQIAEVFPLQEFRPVIDTILASRDERLNVQDFLRTVSSNYRTLWQVIVSLAREQVPLWGRLVDLMVDLQEVARQSDQASVAFLIQQLRVRARHRLCRVFADPTNRLPVMLFDQDAEAKLSSSLLITDRGQPFLDLKHSTLSVAAAITSQFDTALRVEDATPVLLCADDARLPLFRMLQHYDSRIHVLGYAELSEEVPPRPCGFISLPSLETSNG
jgi:hypothetical protein